jgi:hypothetical protein
MAGTTALNSAPAMNGVNVKDSPMKVAQTVPLRTSETIPIPRCWAEWHALVGLVPELARLLEDVREMRRAGRRLDRIWFAPGNVRGCIEMAIDRALRHGAVLPVEAKLIAADRLVGALLTTSEIEERES